MTVPGDALRTAEHLFAVLTAGSVTAAAAVFFSLRTEHPVIRRSLRAFALLLALFLITHASLTVHRDILQGASYSGDETSMHYQAQLFAEGRLWNRPLPPDIAPYFARHHVVVQGDREYSKYPPGQALLLAAALRAGSGSAANIAVTLLSFLLFLHLARLVSGGWRVPLLAAIPFLFSATTIFHAASRFSHPAVMLGILAASLAFAGEMSLPPGPARDRRALLGGFLVGLTLLVRPFDALLAAAAICAVRAGIFFSADGRAAEHRKGALAFLGGGAAGALLFLGYQKLYTGAWFLSPYRLYDPRGEVAAELTLSPAHFFGRGLAELTPQWLAEQAAWSSAVVMALAVLYLVARFFLSGRPAERLFFFLPLFFLIGYAFHNTDGTDRFGARYHYPVLWCWFYGGAAFVDMLTRRLPPRTAFLLVLLFAASVVVPFRSSFRDHCVAVSSEVATRLSLYRAVEERLPARLPAVVLIVRSPRYDGSFYTRNDPAMSDRILYGSYLPDLRQAPGFRPPPDFRPPAAVRAFFPGRPFYRFDHDPATGASRIMPIASASFHSSPAGGPP